MGPTRWSRSREFLCLWFSVLLLLIALRALRPTRRKITHIVADGAVFFLDLLRLLLRILNVALRALALIPLQLPLHLAQANSAAAAAWPAADGSPLAAARRIAVGGLLHVSRSTLQIRPVLFARQALELPRSFSACCASWRCSSLPRESPEFARRGSLAVCLPLRFLFLPACQLLSFSASR